jgi:hypothetical protein
MEIENSEIDQQQDKKHLANVKLSESKKAVKLHIFETDKFYVIPLMELKKSAGKVFEYVEGEPVIIGEIVPPKKGVPQFWVLKVKANIYYLKDTYVQLLLNETNLTLSIFQE